MPKLPIQSGAAKDPRVGSRGYTLSIVLVMITVVAVFCLKGRLYEPTQLIREREAELIYRGEHLARGIVAFRLSAGRYPISLDELDKHRPKLIREIYKDPMTKHGQWTFIYIVPTAPSGNNQGLPIVGVKSRSQRDSLKVYKGKSLHSDWEFSALDPALGGPQPGQQPGQPGQGMPGQGLPSQWLPGQGQPGQGQPGQQGIGTLGGSGRPTNR